MNQPGQTSSDQKTWVSTHCRITKWSWMSGRRHCKRWLYLVEEALSVPCLRYAQKGACPWQDNPGLSASDQWRLKENGSECCIPEDASLQRQRGDLYGHLVLERKKNRVLNTTNNRVVIIISIKSYVEFNWLYSGIRTSRITVRFVFLCKFWKVLLTHDNLKTILYSSNSKNLLWGISCHHILISYSRIGPIERTLHVRELSNINIHILLTILHIFHVTSWESLSLNQDILPFLLCLCVYKVLYNEWYHGEKWDASHYWDITWRIKEIHVPLGND